MGHVFYRGLASHPDHALAKKLLSGFGGVETLIEQPAIMSTASFGSRSGRVRAVAGPAVVAETHPAASLRGPVALAAFTTERYADEPLVIRGPGAGGAVAAAALLADIGRIARAGTSRAGIQGSCATRSASGASSASSSASIPAGS